MPWIDHFIAVSKLEMQVGARGSTRLPYRADYLALADLLSHLYPNLIQMGVAGVATIGMADLDEVAVVAGRPGRDNPARQNAPHGAAERCGQIQSAMVACFTGNRVGPHAEGTGDLCRF